MQPSSLQIVTVQSDLQYRQVRQLIERYAISRNFDAALANIFNEMDKLPEYYPLILMAYWHGQPAGCVAIQVLEEGICEMKRLYVPIDFRGHGIGRQLIATLIEKSRASGFRVMRLDSHPTMTQAQALYRSFGFTEIGRYNQNPIPGIRFFELHLAEGV